MLLTALPNALLGARVAGTCKRRFDLGGDSGDHGHNGKGHAVELHAEVDVVVDECVLIEL